LIEILLVLFVIKLNVLVNLKKKSKMSTITTFKINTNIRFFLMKQPTDKVTKYLKKILFFGRAL